MNITRQNRKVVNIALDILLAFVLWFYVINVENPTGTAPLRELSVEIQGEEVLEDADLMVTDIDPDVMNLKVTGKKKTLMKLDKKNVSLVVDVSSITEPGEYELSVKTVYPAHVNTDNVSVSGWKEMQATVTVAEKKTKTISVRGEFIGTNAENCMAGTVTTQPAELKLTGPEEGLARIAYAQAQVGGDSVSSTISQKVPVVFMDENGVPVGDLENITSNATEVEITVPVRQVVKIPLEVTFQDGGGATAGDVSCKIKPAYVTVEAEPGADIPASINLGTIDLGQVYGDTSYSFPILLPDDVTPWGTIGYASVSVSIDKLTSRQLATHNIELTNVPEGYTAELVSSELYVWVRGIPGQVNKLKSADISVNVDLSDVKPGNGLLRVPAVVSLKEDAKDIGVIGTNYSVALHLTRT